MALKKSYIELGWKIDKSNLSVANSETDKLVNKWQKNRSAVEALNNELARTQRMLRGQATTEDLVADSTKKAAQEESSKANKIKNTTSAQEKATQATKSGTEAVRQGTQAQEQATRASRTHQQAIQESANRMKAVGSTMQNVGRSASVLSLGIGAGFLYSAKQAGKLQNQYTIIKNLAVTGGEKQAEAQRNVNAMQQQGTRYAEKYGVSQKQISAGYEELIRRGYTSKQALGAQKSLLQAAIASGDSYSDVVNGATSALESFGLRSSSTAKMTANTKMAVNQMAYAADLTATNFKDLNYALTYTGPSAKAANQSLAETSSALGVLSNAGQDSTVAGTGLRKVLNSLVSPTKNGMTALQSIGLSPKDLQDAKGNMLPLQDIFKKLDQGMQGMNKTQRLDIFHQLFGTTGQSSALILSDNVNQLAKLNKQVENAQNQKGGGYVASLSTKNLKTFQAQFNRFKQAGEAVGIEMSKGLLPASTKLLGTAADILQKFNTLPKPIRSATTDMVLFTAAIGPALIGIGKVVSAVGTLKGATGSLSLFSKGEAAERAVPETEASLGSAGELEKTATASRGFAGRWSGSTLLGKATLIGTGADIGVSAVKAFREGLGTKQGGSDIWSAGGKTVGAGIGLYLGGPAGAAIGDQIGGYIGKNVHSALTDGSIGKAFKSGETGSNRKYGIGTNGWLAQGAGKAWNAMFPWANDVDKASNSKPRASNRPARTYTSGLDSGTAKFVRQAVSLEQKGNEEWAESAGKTTNTLKRNYNSLYSAAQSYANKRLSSDKKNYSYLEKEGLISASSAKSGYNAEKSSYQKRLSNLKSSLNQLVNADKSGGAKREAEIRKVNQQILSLTDTGGRKQRSLLSALNKRTSQLTTQGYAKIVTSSQRAYKKTVSNASKTYSREVDYANDRYKKEVSSVNKLKGLGSSQRKSIISNAEKQRDKTIDNAHTQYTSTVSWAEKQRKEVIAAAKDEAGSAANAFSTAAKYVSSSIPALIEQNAGVFGGHYQKPKSSTQALKDSENVSGRLASGSRKVQSNSAKVSRFRASLPKTAFGHAAGGPIKKTGVGMVAEAGTELAYNPRTGEFRLLGANGPALAKLHAGEHILNARDTRKVLNGGLGAGTKLRGYAAGTSSLAAVQAAPAVNVKTKGLKNPLSSTEKQIKSSSKKIQSYMTSGFDTKKPTKSLKSFGTSSKKNWNSTEKDTKKITQQIQKNTVGDFDDLQKGSYQQLQQTRSGNRKQLNLMQKDMSNGSSDMENAYQKHINLLDNDSHSAMASAIKQLNKGFGSVNSVLGQFGGSKDVLKMAHYATGTGPIANNQFGVVNDSKIGPHREMILRANGETIAPRGHDVVMPLGKGDQIINGHDVESLKHLPHYKKGTGRLKKIITSNNSKPNKAFQTDFASKLGNGIGTTLSRGISSTDKGASGSVGKPWYSTVWSVLNDAMSSGGSGAGGNWRHNPGMPLTNGFGAPRSFGSHDGNDFAGPIGSAILAMHGGKVIQTGRPGHGWPYSQLGDVIVVSSDDGYEAIYQEFGGMNNIKVHTGDEIHTGQRIATLGHLNGAGSGAHVHVGLSHGSVWDHGGSSTRGWLDITKMHGGSDGTSKSKKKNSKHDSALTKFVKKQIAGQVKWVSKNLSDAGDLGALGLSGSVTARARTLAAAIKKAYPSATNAGIAAVLGNWEFESGLNPGAINPGGGASGLGQWLGPRKSSLINYAQRHHMSWKNAGAQLDFALHGDGANSSILKSVLRGSGSIAALANRFSSEWERGGYNAEHVAGARKIEGALKGMATGGNTPLGHAVLVGEHGPELAEFKQPTTLRTAADTRQAMTKFGRNKQAEFKNTFNIKVSINMKNGDAKSIAKQIKSSLQDQLGDLFQSELDNLAY